MTGGSGESGILGSGGSAEWSRKHARIARALAGALSAEYGKVGGVPPYVRRHIIEHAVEGGVLPEVLTAQLAPWLDITGIRSVPPEVRSPVLSLIRKAAHSWTFQDPPQLNAAALRFLAATEANAVVGFPTAWDVPWAKPIGPSEIVVRRGAVAVDGAELAPGRIVVVTAGPAGVLVHHPGSSDPVRLPRQEAPPTTVALLPDGPSGNLILLVGDEDGDLGWWRLRWDEQSRSVIAEMSRRLVSGSEEVTALAWRAEREALVGRARGSLSVEREGSAGGLHADLSGATPTGLAVLDMGLVFSVDRSGHLRAWDLPRSRMPVATAWVGDRPAAIAAVQAESDVPALLVVADCQLQLWNLTPGHGTPVLERRTTVDGFDAAVTAVAAWAGSADEAVAVAGDDRGQLHIVDLNLAEVVRSVDGHAAAVRGLACVPTGSVGPVVLSVADDGCVRRWDGLLQRCEPASRSWSAARPARGSADPSGPSVRTWRIQDGLEVGIPMPARVHRYSAVAVVRGAEDKRLAITTEPAVQLAEPSASMPLLATTVLDGQPIAVTAAGDTLNIIKLVPGPAATAAGRSMRHRGVAALAAIALDGGRAVAVSAGDDRTLRFWDLRNATMLDRIATGRGATVLAPATSPAGHRLVVAGHLDTSLRVWDVATLQEIGPLRSIERRDKRQLLALDAGFVAGRLVAVGARLGEESVCRWYLDDTEDKRRSLPSFVGTASAVAISLGPRRPAVVVGGGDQTLWVLDLETGDRLIDPMPVTGRVTSIACLADEPAAVIAGDGILALVRWRQ